MAERELVALQVAGDGPRPEGMRTATNLLLPPRRTTDRFSHFPEEVYDLSAESHLARFLKVLIGDSGAGQLRKRLLMARLQQTVQGIHFYDLDRFYGNLFGVRRSLDETLSLDPYTQTATSDEWSVQHAKDASYRSRVSQFARSIQFGATPTGMELVSEALLSIDCDVYESYIQSDSSYQTYAEIEAQYATYGAMEGVGYGTLEGDGLGRLSGNDRRLFTIRPKRPITQSEAYELGRVITRLKPADARFAIDVTGANVFIQSPIRGLRADSDLWEVVAKVSTRPSVLNPYQISSTNPVEQPRPPFSAYQGEAWSYVGDVIGVSAYTKVGLEVPVKMPPQRVALPDDTFISYYVHEALLPKRHILAGRSVSDGVMVAHSYWASSPHTKPDLAPIYTDRIALDSLNTLLERSPIIDALPQNPAERFWATPERAQTDPTTEVFELRLGSERLVNHISFEAAHFPQNAVVYAFVGSDWVEIGRRAITDSVPQFLPPGEVVFGHPHHSRTGHWQYLGVTVGPVTTSRVRIELTRSEGVAPRRNATEEVPYSLALRAVDVGYRVRSLEDVPEASRTGGAVIGATTDAVGSQVEFVLRQETAERLLEGASNTWRSEPQPVNFAVVNLYLDVRSSAGDSQVIDSFYLNPTHPGAHLTIYWTEEVGEPTDTEWYEQRVWRPVPRDYRLQKGYLRLPPIRARHFKFEFTGLVAEQYETLLPLTRKVRLFPQALVSRFTQSSTLATEDLPAGIKSALEINTDVRYADAVRALRNEVVKQDRYDPTEALYAENPLAGRDLSDRSWAFGFQPWHQGEVAPRFINAEVHRYQNIEIQHTTKVGFFVGLYDIRAFRSDIGADDDTQVYAEHFHDFRNIQPGFTWTFDPNILSSQLATDVVAQSRVYNSLHNVTAVQFATQQTPPVQIVPDDDFRDPALSSNDWANNSDGWHKVGDAAVVYSPADHSVRVVRYAVPLETPTVIVAPGTRDHYGLVSPVIQPVFSSRRPVVEEPAPAPGDPTTRWGGIESPLVGVSVTGRMHVAVRVTIESALSSPLLLQVVNNAGTVLMSSAVTGEEGEVIEHYAPYDLTGLAAVKVRVIQEGASDDQWKVDTLSAFDDGILWEFSVNGGDTWVPALGVRNNANGIVTFPESGNQLVWRVRGLRSRLTVSSLRIRPHYIGGQNARFGAPQRGPNVSVFDAAVPITEDPEFTTWPKPVPRSWFLAYKRFPTLPVEGAPNVTEFARFYGRPSSDSVAAPTDVVTRFHLNVRRGTDLLITSDAASRAGSTYFRSGVDSVSAATDSAITTKTFPPGGGVVNIPVHPVF